MSVNEQFSEDLNKKYVFVHPDKWVTEDGILLNKKELNGVRREDLKILYAKRLGDKKNILYSYDKAKEGILAAKEEPVQTTKTEEIIPVTEESMEVLWLALTFLIGASCAVISFLYTFLQLSKTRVFIIAFLLATSFIVFNTIALRLAALYNKKGTRLLAFALVCMMIITVSYSMSNALEYNYTEYQNYLAKEINSDTNAAIRAKIKAKETEVEQQQDVIAQAEKTVVTQDALIEEYKKQGYGILGVTRDKKALEDKVLAEKNKLTLLINEKAALIASSPAATSFEDKKTIYKFLEDQFGLNSETTRFVFDTFPILFVDILSPLCLTLGTIQLRKRRKCGKTK